MASGAHKNYALIYHGDPALIYLLRHVGDSSSGRAMWRCGGRRVELENLSGAHGGNDKPAPVQSPKRGAARQASKRANQYLSCVYRDNQSAINRPGLPRSG